MEPRLLPSGSRKLTPMYDDHPTELTPAPPSQPAPPAAAPAKPYVLHNPEAVRQHLRGLGDQEVLRLHTSGTTQRIRAATLVQAATLVEGVRDFLFDAFLQVARHDRPQLADPDGESPPPTGIRIWVLPIDWGPHLVRQPMPGRLDNKGRSRYHEPNMAHPPPSASPSDTKAWERETWVDGMAFLRNFMDHIPGDVPTPDNQQPAPSTYMTFMYNIHNTLSTTQYDAPTGHWVVHGIDSLLLADYAPPPRTPLEARQPPADPCPPPPPSSTERPFGCGALWAPSSTRAVAPQPVQPALVAPRAGKHTLRLGAPPSAQGTPSAVGAGPSPRGSTTCA